MIFKMLSKDFKNIIDRLYIVVPKVSVIPALHGVQIIADKENDTLLFRVSDLESYLTINANMRDVEIVEGGKVIIDIDCVKKLFPVEGWVTYERKSNSFSAANEKKKNRVSCFKSEDDDSIVNFPENPKEDSIIMTIPDRKNFITVLENLAPCLSVEQHKPIYTGYNFNSGKYGIIAIDGYHALSYFNPWCVEGKQFNFGVPGIACKQLKKIANNKTENSELKVYFSGRHVHFVGDDFILTQRIIEGNFVDFAQTVDMNDSDYTVTLNCAEFLKIAKEYATLNKKTPIIHCVECSGKLATETHSSDFQTADCISIEDGKLSENLHIAFNAKYMADVLKVFKDTNTTISGGKEIYPWKFLNENYVALVVPMRLEKESKEFSELYIREAFCS